MKRQLRVLDGHTEVLTHPGGVGDDVQRRQACLSGAPGRMAFAQALFQR